jgi:REP element-mobilizing transposase RayT
MTSPTPIYTLENCHPAYQLNWSLSVFWREPPPDAGWLDALTQATEPDGVRILNHQFTEPAMSQFLLSTKPSVAPHAMVRSVKGRLQYLVRKQQPKAFQRNYCLRSVGSPKREDVENYVHLQAGHHPMADPRVQAVFERYQVCRAAVDLSEPRQGDHSLYWYNLHIVLVRSQRLGEISEERIAAAKATILAVSDKHGYLLSRAGILCDHIHLALGGRPDQSPGETALRFANNLAYREGMKWVFEFGYYVGTFGEYDLGAIPRA